MRPVLAGLLSTMLSMPTLLAQPAPGGPAPRQWPVAGKWRVGLVQTPPSAGGRFACMLTVGDQSVRPSNPTQWSFRYGRDELLIIENSIGAGDATIPELAVTVDGRRLGAFRITSREHPAYPPSVVAYVSAIAPVTDPAARRRIVDAIRPASVIRIERSGAAVEEALDEKAAAYFDECRRGLVP